MQKLEFNWWLVGAVFLGVASASAQDIKLQSGSLDFLKGEPALNLEYVYDGLSVGKVTEQAYVDEKVAEYNKKEAGKGDAWLASWKSDREKRFQPKFEELLNKQFTEKKITLNAGAHPAAKFTLVVKTTNLEPGWNAAIMRRPAAVNTEMDVYATNARHQPLAVIPSLQAPGQAARGYDDDVGYRLQEGYAKTGKELGKFLIKKALK